MFLRFLVHKLILISITHGVLRQSIFLYRNKTSETADTRHAKQTVGYLGVDKPPV